MLAGMYHQKIALEPDMGQRCQEEVSRELLYCEANSGLANPTYVYYPKTTTFEENITKL